MTANDEELRLEGALPTPVRKFLSELDQSIKRQEFVPEANPTVNAMTTRQRVSMLLIRDENIDEDEVDHGVVFSLDELTLISTKYMMVKTQPEPEIIGAFAEHLDMASLPEHHFVLAWEKYRKTVSAFKSLRRMPRSVVAQFKNLIQLAPEIKKANEKLLQVQLQRRGMPRNILCSFAEATKPPIART